MTTNNNSSHDSSRLSPVEQAAANLVAAAISFGFECALSALLDAVVEGRTHITQSDLLNDALDDTISAYSDEDDSFRANMHMIASHIKSKGYLAVVSNQKGFKMNHFDEFDLATRSYSRRKVSTAMACIEQSFRLYGVRDEKMLSMVAPCNVGYWFVVCGCNK